MSCTDCGASPADTALDDKPVALIRQNSKGVAGIWKCTDCCDQPPPQIVNTIRNLDQ